MTWQIPIEYQEHAQAPKFMRWLQDSVGGNADQVQLLRAYINCILTGRADLQRYLEIIGPGGTGKGTFIRICELVVGEENSHSTELKHLENSRFETANIYGKRLVVITDSQNYAGDVSVLKALTGQDTIRYEEKNKQGGLGYKAQCMVIIAANESIQSKDYTSGISRRRITVAFTNRVKSSDRRDLVKEFTPELPGIINWALEMPVATVESLVRDTSDTVSSLAETFIDNLINTNPIAQWLDEKCVYLQGSNTQVGIARRENGAIADSDTMLYPSYVQFCEDSGIKALALNRWSNLLLELCNYQLNIPDIKRIRNRDGRFIENLSIRFNETDPSPVRLKLANRQNVLDMPKPKTTAGLSETAGKIIEYMLGNDPKRTELNFELKAMRKELKAQENMFKAALAELSRLGEIKKSPTDGFVQLISKQQNQEAA